MKQWMMNNCNANLKMVAERYKISEKFAEILVKRGLFDWDAMDKYLFPDIDKMYKPEKMKDLVKAGELLGKAIDSGKKIMIIGDYDVDGIMSTYILYRGISMLGGSPMYRIPHRVKDGYGIRDYMVDEAVKQGAEIIITCDNGISAIEAAKRAGELGITYIITDHHEVFSDENGEVIPPADAVVNPKQEQCGYPFKMLCGAGIAYKLMSYLFEKKGDKSYVDELLPFAAAATVCDVVPLIDENRVIVSNGLKIMSDKSRMTNIGMKSLIKELGLEGGIRSSDLGFGIGPCLNAAGRLDDAKRGIELLLEEDMAKAEVAASELAGLNEERKDITAKATEAAIREIERDDALKNPVLVVYIKNCHESVAGIVAGRIREKYYRPTLVLTDGEKSLKGSARSIPEYHMQEALSGCQDLLVEFGGHAMAAGFSVMPENLNALREKLNAQSGLNPDELIEKITIDCELPLGEASVNFVSQLKYMEPLGEENPGALFFRSNLKVISMSMCGKENQIARLRIEDEGKVYNAVDFRAELHIGAAMCDKYGEDAWKKMKMGNYGQMLDILYVPEINDRFGGVQFRIVDCRVSQSVNLR